MGLVPPGRGVAGSPRTRRSEPHESPGGTLNMTRELWIPARMPGLNELVGENPYVYNKAKQKWSHVIGILARAQRFEPVTSPAHFVYEFVEPDRKRDPSNFCFAAAKFIEDALQVAGLLKNDGWKHVSSFAFTWKVGNPSGVKVRVTT